MNRVNGTYFKGRNITLELSEDLSREEKEAARQNKLSEEFGQWKGSIPPMGSAQGFQPYPGPSQSRRGLSSPREEYWPSQLHVNKMRIREGGMSLPTKPQPYPYQMLSVDHEFGRNEQHKDPSEVNIN